MDKLYELLLSRVPQSSTDHRLEMTPELKSQFDSLKKHIHSLKFEVEFRKMTTDSDRAKYVLTSLPVCEFISMLVDKFRSGHANGKKNSTQASNCIKNGNASLNNDQYVDALEDYSEAIRFAPRGDHKQLAHAYGYRSFAFQQLKQYESALKDIDAMFELVAKPEYSYFTRKCECLIELGRVTQARQVREELRIHYSPNIQQLFSRTLDRLLAEYSKRVVQSTNNNECVNTDSLKNLSSVIEYLSDKGRFQPQPDFASLSSKVKVHHDKKNGHHLVTTEDIKFGDILAVTKPYASVLTDKQEGHFCHHCLAALKLPGRISRLVPCGQCSRVLYCSDKCRLDSWQSYHRIECPLLPLSTEGFYLDQFLAFRTYLISGGLDSIRNVVAKYKNWSEQQVMKLTDNHEDYENVYQLSITTKADREPIYHRHDIEDIVVLGFLAKLTRIDATGTDSEFTANDILTTEVLVRHLAQIRANGWFIYKGDTQSSTNNSPTSEHFSVLDPVISLVNSSCRPNVSIINVDSVNLSNCDTNSNRFGSNLLVLFAHQLIPAGSVLSAMLPWKRHEEVWCPCHECERERYDSTYGTDYPVFYSIVCRSPISNDPNDACDGLWQKLPPKDITAAGKQYECTKCHKGVTQIEYRKVFDQMEECELKVDGLLMQIEKSFNDNDDTKAKMYHIFYVLHSKMSPLFLPYNGSQLSKHFNRLSSLFLSAGFNHNQLKIDFVQIAWKCVEGSRTALESQFGGDSEAQLRMLRDCVKSFRPVVNWLNLYLAEMTGNTVQERLLIQNFEVIEKRVQKMQDLYNLV